MKKKSRNALCPCGSGKKYKKCCGAVQPEFNQLSERAFFLQTCKKEDSIYHKLDLSDHFHSLKQVREGSYKSETWNKIKKKASEGKIEVLQDDSHHL